MNYYRCQFCSDNISIRYQEYFIAYCHVCNVQITVFHHKLIRQIYRLTDDADFFHALSFGFRSQITSIFTANETVSIPGIILDTNLHPKDVLQEAKRLYALKAFL